MHVCVHVQLIIEYRTCNTCVYTYANNLVKYYVCVYIYRSFSLHDIQHGCCKQCFKTLSRMRRCQRVPATPSAACAGPLLRTFSRVAPGTRAPCLNSDSRSMLSWMLQQFIRTIAFLPADFRGVRVYEVTAQNIAPRALHAASSQLDE